MAFQNIGVILNIGGKVQGSLSSSFNIATQGLRRLQSQASATSSAFARMGSGLVGLLGLGTGIAGIASISAFMAQAVKLGKEQENVTGNLYILLQNSARLRGQDARMAGAQLRTIQAQSRVMQEMSGISSTIYTKGAATLVTAGLTTKQIADMQPLMANLMAYQTRMGKSSEQLAEMYKVIGRAVHTGAGRGLNQMGIMLSPFEQKMMRVNAGMHRYAENLVIIRRHMQIFNGDAASFLRTAQGQSALAMTHVEAWQRLIGKAFLPVQYQLTVIYAKLVELFGPYVIRACQAFASALGVVNQWLNNNRVAIQAGIKTGWEKLIQVIGFIRQHWVAITLTLGLLTAAFVAWTFVIAPLISIVTAFGLTLIALPQLFSLIVLAIGALVGADAWIALTIGLGAAAVAVIANWGKVQDFFQNFWQNLSGGQVPTLTGPPIQEGWIGTLNKWGAMWDAWLPEQWGKFVKWIESIGKSWDAAVIGWVTNAGNLFSQWIKGLGDAWNGIIAFLKLTFGQFIQRLDTLWVKAIALWWTPMIEGIKSVGVAMWKWLVKPFEDLNEQWKKFLGFIGVGGPDKAEGTGYESGGGDGKSKGKSGGWGAATTGVNWAPNGLPPQADGLTPRVARLANVRFNNPGAMQLTQSAIRYGGVNSNTWDTGHRIAMFPTPEQGAAAQFSMWWNGAYRNHSLAGAIKNWVGAGETGEDTSMSKQTGFPLNGIVSDDVLKGEMGIRLMAAQAKVEGANVLTHAQWKKAQDIWKAKQFGETPKKGDGASTTPITINHSVTYHIHGGDEHKIAVLHQKHIEKLKDDLEEAQYEKNRRRFA